MVGFTPTPRPFPAPAQRAQRSGNAKSMVGPNRWAAWAARVRTSTTGTRRIDVAGQAFVVLLRQVSRFSRQPWIAGIYFPATEMNRPIKPVAAGLCRRPGHPGAGRRPGPAAGGAGLARPIRRLAAAAAAVSAFDFFRRPTHRQQPLARNRRRGARLGLHVDGAALVRDLRAQGPSQPFAGRSV